MTVGELFSGDPALAPKLSAPRHLVFDFELIRQHWNAEGFADASQKHEERFGDDAWPTIVLSNHDQSRQASRLAPGADAETSDEIARAAAVLSLTMRGTPFLYYGEELGARDVPVPWSEIIDPPAKRGGRLVRRLVPWWNRDQARSPMPWGGGGANGGFSTARPWLRMAPDVETRNVAVQDADPTVGPVDVPHAGVAAPALSGAPGRTLSAAARRRRATCTPSSVRPPTSRSSWPSISGRRRRRCGSGRAAAGPSSSTRTNPPRPSCSATTT